MFRINYNTRIVSDNLSSIAIDRAISRFYRDITFTLKKTDENGSLIKIIKDTTLDREAWIIDIKKDCITLYSKGEEGGIYGLIYISQRYLKIKPLWYWCDQHFTKKDYISVKEETISSQSHAFFLRGWFINDEVLFLGWHPSKSDEEWEMAFEALLRLGGNIVIPGTDKNSRKYARLASDTMSLS